MKVTIDDVAREAGVSTATVSRVINRNYPVAPKTRERVEAAIEKLEFSPNILAKGLMMKRTNSIGVVIPSVMNPYFWQIVHKIEAVLKEHNYMAFLCYAVTAKEEYDYIRNLIQRSVDGIIIVDGTSENRNNGYFERISKEVPLVLINGLHQGYKVNHVMADQETGAKDALRYLHSLGHRKIAYVTGLDPKVYAYGIKEKAYKEFLQEKGLPFNPDNILRLPGELGTRIIEVADAVEVLRSRFQKPDPPTAFFAANDVMGISLIHGAKALGLSVPEDLSIVGFDDGLLAKISNPLLTTVDINTEELGLQSARMIIDTIENGQNTGYKKVILNTKLVLRDSCRPLY
ncbi:LacI family DNA-binding transcriptional regulator [Anaerotalea alkaliphila]|uniref:LacI family transcriptional regulator n=1 Tax=Anaerotalea alkaliphila TaxID=2662126 RepID=A0A7X5HTG6_9FIRM|nr:LacI family DNA-binding transcriptional regulator [Anaerotalea alkaliphila]NDL66343.1 LacI family transcriptional regulator [Anaerotalea alkaliphila]